MNTMFALDVVLGPLLAEEPNGMRDSVALANEWSLH